ncbi:MAG: glycosyltransferase family 4 protein [Gemmatimonadales bacterium]
MVPWDQSSGGVATVVDNLAEWLQERGSRTVFLHPGESNRIQEQKTSLGYPGYQLNLRAPWEGRVGIKSLLGFLVHFPGTCWQLAALLRRERIGVVNVHYPTPFFFYFGLLRRLLRFQLVISVHGSDLVPIEPDQRPSRTVRFLLRSADRVVAPSEGFLAEVLTRYPELAGKAIVIHNGIQFDPPPLEVPPFEGPARQPYILCVAAHNSKKGIDVLLNAFVSIRGARPDLRLRLAGEGPLTPELKRLANFLGLDDSVEFLGTQSPSEIAYLLRHCELFVLASRSESFGISALEALFMGRTVVATAVGGLPEVIVPGRSGILVPPDDPNELARAIMAGLSDPELRKALAESGEAHARTFFTRDIMGAKYEQLYLGVGGERLTHSVPSNDSNDPRTQPGVPQTSSDRIP